MEPPLGWKSYSEGGQDLNPHPHSSTDQLTRGFYLTRGFLPELGAIFPAREIIPVMFVKTPTPWLPKPQHVLNPAQAQVLE